MVWIEAIFNLPDQIPAGSGGLVGRIHRMNSQAKRKHSSRRKSFHKPIVTAHGSLVFSGFVSVIKDRDKNTESAGRECAHPNHWIVT